MWCFKSAPSNLSNCKILQKKKKSPNVQPDMPYLGIFGVDFWKTMSIFEMRTLKFLIEKILRKKKNAYVWDQKCLIWVLLDYILKNYCHIWNQHPQIFLIAKFYQEKKMPKFATKYALFKYFWCRIIKNYIHISNQHSQICLIVIFCKKQPKMRKSETKDALFGYFWARFLKNYCHSWNQHGQIFL